MEKFVSQSAYLTVNEYELIQSCLDYARIKIPDNHNDDLHFNVTTFQTFVNYLNYDFIGSFEYKIPRAIVTLQFMKFYYHLRGAHSKYSPTQINGEIQCWIHFKLKSDFGHHLLRNKTLQDKIIGWLTSTGYKIKSDKAFSKKFLLLSENSNQAEHFFNSHRRSILLNSDLEQVFVELKRDDIIIGTRKALDLTEFAKVLMLAAGVI